MSSKIILLLIFICFPLTAQARIVFDSASSGGDSTTGTGLAVSHTIGDGRNKILIVYAGARNNPQQQATGITYNGIAMTNMVSTVGSGGQTSGTMWYLLNPPSGTANIVGTWPSTTRRGIVAASYFNVRQINVPDARTVGASSNAPNVGAVSSNIVVNPSGSVVVSGMNGSTGSSAASPMTQRASVNATDIFVRLGDATVTAPSTFTASWSGGWQFASYVMVTAVLAPLENSINNAVLGNAVIN